MAKVTNANVAGMENVVNDMEGSVMENTVKAVKLTKKDKFGMLLEIEEVASNPVLVEFINKELDLLARKNTGRKQTPAQKDNDTISARVLEVLGEDPEAKFTATQLAKTVTPLVKLETCEEISVSRMSAVLRKLGKDGTNEVKKIVEKRVSYFQINLDD